MARDFQVPHMNGPRWSEIAALIRTAAHLADNEGPDAAASISWRLADALGLISQEAPAQAMGVNEPTGRGYMITKRVS